MRKLAWFVSMVLVTGATAIGDQWEVKAPYPVPTSGVGAAAVGSKIYAMGGKDSQTSINNSVYEYDTIANAWTTKNPMPLGRRSFAIGEVGGLIYVIAGSDVGSGPINALDAVQVYDPQTDSWQDLSPIPTPRFWPNAAVVNGKIYVVGGSTGAVPGPEQMLNVVEEYDPATDSWTLKSPMPTARKALAVTAANGRVYAIAGETSSSVQSQIVEEYDPESDTWTTRAVLPTGKSGLSAASLNGNVYAIGGWTSSPSERVDEFDPVTDSWTQRASLSVARSGPGVAVAGGKIYAIGGYTGSRSDIVEAYTPLPPVPGPDTQVNIGPAVYYERTSSEQSLYQLFERDSPFTNVWHEIGGMVPGTGDTIYGFERGTSPPWLPARGWNITDNTDGYSLQFDSTDDFAFRVHDTLLNLDSGMTLEAWVKPGAAGAAGVIVAKAASPSITSYRLGLDGSDRATFQVSNAAGNPFIDLTAGIVLTNETWTHLAATYDGSTAKLLLNGLLDSSLSATGSVRISGLSPFVVGGILGTDTFNGLIDEIRIWDHARTEQDILANYATKLDGNESGLVAYWQLQEPGSQMASDTTANALDLTLGDTGNPESFDPTWFAESFPSGSVFQEIFQFGTRWFSVFWETQAGETYSLESAMDLTTGSWSTVLDNVQGTGGEVEYFEPPLGDPGFAESKYYRVLGPPGTLGSNVTQGLVAYYAFNGSADDESANGNDGTIFGATPSADRNGTGSSAYEFDGVDDYIRVNGSSDFGFTNFTASAWIRADDYMTNKAHVIFGTLTNGGTRGGFQVVPNGGTLKFVYRTATGAAVSVIAPPVFSSSDNGLWHHVAFTCSYDGSETTVNIYVDGVSRHSETRTAAPPNYDNQDFLIGLNYDSSVVGGSFVREYGGGLDEIRIYNRALTSNEVWNVFSFSDS